MQTTLLGLAVAMILALVTALVGPLFIDWNQYRSVFEAQATRLVGMPVRIKGAIEVRLLPTPSAVLRDLEIGAADEPVTMRARSIGVELALGPLMRGRWHASELRIDAPQLALGLDRSGRVVGVSQAIGFDPDSFSVERLVIENGHVSLSDAGSGTAVVLDKLRFKGDVRSLIGPFKGEGAFVASGALYGYQVSAGRRDDNGAIKLRLDVDPVDRPLTIATEGTLRVENGIPRYEGGVKLARPVGMVLASGKTLLNDPWHATSRIKASPSAALLEQIEFEYGAENREISLSGTAKVQFGRHPHFDGIMTARRLDLDRAFGKPEERRRPPLAVLQAMAASIGEVIRPPIAVRLGIGIDTVTLGGAALQTVRGDFESAGDAWKVGAFEFRAPGLTQVKVSGRLQVAANAATFTGPADVEASNPEALIAWIEGRPEPSQSPPGALHARGDVTLARDRIAIGGLKAEFNGKTLAGRVDYAFAAGGHPARLDAALSAPEFDFDSAAAFATAAFANTAFDRPGEIALALDVGHATVEGVEVKQAKAKLKLDAAGLQIEHLSIADLGGAALTASGKIDTSTQAARGELALNVDAQSLDGVAAIAARFAPQAADMLRTSAAQLAPAKIKAKLDMEASPEARTGAMFHVQGQVGALRVAFKVDANGELAAPKAADLKFDGHVDAADGTALARLLGLDRVVAVDSGRPGHLSLSAHGTLDKGFRVQGRLSTGGFQSAAGGTMRLADGVSGNLDLSLVAADIPKLHRDVLATLPIALKTKLSVAGRSLALTDLSGTVAGAAVRGRLDLMVADPIHVGGRIEAQTVNAAVVLASVLGTPRQAPGSDPLSHWSADPFRAGPLGNLDGGFAFELADAALTPRFAIKDLRGTVQFDRASLALTDLDGVLAEGRLTGQVNFTRDSSGLATHARLALTGANAAALIPGSNGEPPLSGRVTLQLEAGGAGLSPAALVGSLNGTGSVSIKDPHIADFDSRVFGAVNRAVERGLPADAIRVGDFVAKQLDGGRLEADRADGAITIANGQLRLGTVVAHAENADLAMSGTADLGEEAVDLHFTLSGAPVEGVLDGRRPELSVTLKGPFGSPQRSVDVSTLVGWLTLRSVEREAKRLEAIEAARRDAAPVGSIAPGAHPQPPIRNSLEPSPQKAPDLPPPINVKPAPGPPVHRGRPSSSAAENRLRPLILLPQLP